MVFEFVLNSFELSNGSGLAELIGVKFQIPKVTAGPDLKWKVLQSHLKFEC